MGRHLLALTLTGALAFWSFGCEADRPADEPASPPTQEREPASPPDEDEPGSPPDDNDDEPGSP